MICDVGETLLLQIDIRDIVKQKGYDLAFFLLRIAIGGNGGRCYGIFVNAPSAPAFDFKQVGALFRYGANEFCRGIP